MTVIRFRSGLCGAFFSLLGRSARTLGEVKSPPLASSHEGWGICTERQRQAADEDDLVIVITEVAAPVEWTVAGAEARVGESSR
jgi:hypothetical protein